MRGGTTTTQDPLRLSLGDIAPPQMRGGIVAVGNFDGVHRGHQALLAEASYLGARSRRPALALTFSPHPRIFFGRTEGFFHLTDDREKAALLKAHGADEALFLTFERNVASLSGERFVTAVLQSMLGAEHVIVGHDFRFGSDLCSVNRLAHYGQERGFAVTIVPPVMFNGRRISSTSLRLCKLTGDKEKAMAMFGADRQGGRGCP